MMTMQSRRGGTDRELLRKLLDREEITKSEREAFAEMAEEFDTGVRLVLSAKQRDWAKRVLERHEPTYENLVSSGKVPRGREVPTPLALQNLPLKPPGRR